MSEPSWSWGGKREGVGRHHLTDGRVRVTDLRRARGGPRSRVVTIPRKRSPSTTPSELRDMGRAHGLGRPGCTLSPGAMGDGGAGHEIGHLAGREVAVALRREDGPRWKKRSNVGMRRDQVTELDQWAGGV